MVIAAEVDKVTVPIIKLSTPITKYIGKLLRSKQPK